MAPSTELPGMWEDADLTGGETDTLESFTCPVCKRTSRDPNDVREGYCGNCHNWTGNKQGSPKRLHDASCPLEVEVINENGTITYWCSRHQKNAYELPVEVTWKYADGSTHTVPVARW